jgi:hypothetical protein
MQLPVSLSVLLVASLALTAPERRSSGGQDPRPIVDVRADTTRELRGTYETGFEVSWFHPCGAPAGDDLWWVTLSDGALRQRDSLAKKLSDKPRSVYLRLRGTTSPKMPAGTGHMGRGSRYLFVTEILELRSADEAGCSAA